MRGIRTVLAGGALVATAVLALPAVSAGAASSPGNDNPGNAKVIGSLPFKLTQSTSGASSSDVERRLNAQCGAPVIRKAVWFKFTPGNSFRLRVSGEGSSYSVGFIVATGPPASATVVTCGPLSVIQEVTKGTSYWILAFDDTPGSAGGTLRLSVTKALPLPSVAVTVKRGVAKPSTGAARLFGTASCKGQGSQLVFVGATLEQSSNSPTPTFGSLFIGLTVQCGNTPISWQADAFPEPIFSPDPTQPPITTRFLPGPVNVNAQAAACNTEQQCTDATSSVIITLTRP